MVISGHGSGHGRPAQSCGSLSPVERWFVAPQWALLGQQLMRRAVVQLYGIGCQLPHRLYSLLVNILYNQTTSRCNALNNLTFTTRHSNALNIL